MQKNLQIDIKKGYAVWGKKRHFFNIPKNRGLKVSEIEDIKIFKNIIREKKNKSKFSIIKFKNLKKRIIKFRQ